MAWTKSPKQDFSQDKRGWRKDKGRKYTNTDKNRIKSAYLELKKEDKIFTGASAVLQRYRLKHPKAKSVTLRFIGTTLTKLGFTEKRVKGRNKGASCYLHYPAYSIEQLGGSLLEIDFIGKKFIRNRTEPINFIAFSLKKPRKLKHFQRITGETANNVIMECKRFFKKFEKPEAVKIDNGFAFIGSGHWPRTISKTAIFFLEEKIIPIFTAPRKPWNQASVEGANSVFSRKFWNRSEFKNTRDIDLKLDQFNKEYQEYLEYHPSQKARSFWEEKFVPKIYFIRKVYEDEESKKGYIELVHEKIYLLKSYINFFILAEWNLKQEQLYIYFEKEQQLKMVKKLLFKINQRSGEKVSHFIV